MYWILFVMAAIAAVVIALVVGGLATPRTHLVARSMVVPVALDEAWNAVRDSVQGGSMSFAVREEQAPRRLVADRLDDNLQPAGAWSWLLEPEGAGTRITLTQRGSIGNPIARFLGAYLGHTRQMDLWLRELASRFPALSATIEVAAPTES